MKWYLGSRPAAEGEMTCPTPFSAPGPLPPRAQGPWAGCEECLLLVWGLFSLLWALREAAVAPSQLLGAVLRASVVGGNGVAGPGIPPLPPVGF